MLEWQSRRVAARIQSASAHWVDHCRASIASLAGYYVGQRTDSTLDWLHTAYVVIRRDHGLTYRVALGRTKPGASPAGWWVGLSLFTTPTLTH